MGGSSNNPNNLKTSCNVTSQRHTPSWGVIRPNFNFEFAETRTACSGLPHPMGSKRAPQGLAVRHLTASRSNRPSKKLAPIVIDYGSGPPSKPCGLRNPSRLLNTQNWHNRNDHTNTFQSDNSLKRQFPDVRTNRYAPTANKRIARKYLRRTNLN